MINLCFSALFSIIFAVCHPLHLSVTTLEINKLEKNCQLGFKFFVDDFQEIIYLKYNEKLDFKQKAQNQLSSQLIAKYLNERFKIIIKESPDIQSVINDIEFETDELSIYIKTKINMDCYGKNIIVENSLMNDMYYDQTNLMIVKQDDLELSEKYSYLVVKKEIKLTL